MSFVAIVSYGLFAMHCVFVWLCFLWCFGFVCATKELMDFCRDARIVGLLFPFLFLLCALSLVCSVCVVVCCVVVLFLFVLFCFVFVMGLLCGTPACFRPDTLDCTVAQAGQLWCKSDIGPPRTPNKLDKSVPQQIL